MPPSIPVKMNSASLIDGFDLTSSRNASVAGFLLEFSASAPALLAHVQVTLASVPALLIDAPLPFYMQNVTQVIDVFCLSPSCSSASASLKARGSWAFGHSVVQNVSLLW